MSYYSSNTGKCRSRVVSGLFRALTLSLLAAVFGFIPLQAQTAYVANAGSNSVSVIDTATNTVTATIPLASSPAPVVASPDGSRVYVGDSTFDFVNGCPCPSGTVYVIDTSTNTVVRTIPLANGEDAARLAITPDGKTLYGSADTTGDVIVIDIASGNITATTPGVGGAAIVITPNGDTIYVSNGFNAVTAIGTASNTVTATIPVGATFPGNTQLAITPDGSFLYVPLSGTDQVAVIATATNNVVGTPISVVPGPFGVGITSNGAFAYVTGGISSGGVSVIRTVDNTVAATIPINTNINDVAFTPDNSFAYFTLPNSGNVSVIATATNTVVATVPVGSFPLGIVMVKAQEPPTAVAGPNQTVTVQQTVHLDGTASFAPNTPSADLQYAWSFVLQPFISSAALSGANTATPSFVADAPGTFIVQLVVTDPATGLSSAPSQVTISSIWSPPMANAGVAQSVNTGSVVQLNGTGSIDPNGLSLTFAWSFLSKPAGSTATITPGTPGLASFIADVAGVYTVQLVVSDQFGSSQPSTVTITATTPETAQQLIQDAINYIAAMQAANFDAAGHRTALDNFLQQAIADIQKGNTSQAISKLLNDAIIRTDGFPLRGAVDGSGPGMDWIIDQTDQEFVYNKLIAAINLLQ
jgi:YVTN family beta-propeller protein